MSLSFIARFFILGCILSLCFAIWAFLIEPNLLEISHYQFSNAQLKNLRIVFASDFHLAPSHQKRFDKILQAVEKQHPDLIILGGDYVYGHTVKSSMSIDKIAENLGRFKAPLGVIAVLGNHDSYLEAQTIATALERQGITVLQNSNIELSHQEQKFFVAGIKDYITQISNIEGALKNTSEPRIFVSHTPDVFPSLKQKVTLALAGHTHGGQVKAPFYGAILVPSAYGTHYAEGLLYEEGNNLLISKGLGTSLLPMRFNCKPEIVVIDFK